MSEENSELEKFGESFVDIINKTLMRLKSENLIKKDYESLRKTASIMMDEIVKGACNYFDEHIKTD